MRYFFFYILASKKNGTLYIGVTNDLNNRLFEHREESKHGKRSFAGKYNAYYLVYFEHFDLIEEAIA